MSASPAHLSLIKRRRALLQGASALIVAGFGTRAVAQGAALSVQPTHAFSHGLNHTLSNTSSNTSSNTFSTAKAQTPSNATARLVALRTWPAKEYVRVTLEYTGALAHSTFLTDQGAPRLVVDLDGLPWSTDVQARLTTEVAANPFVARVRAAQQGEGVRMVLDLKRNVLAQVASVAAVGAYKPRLLIDLYPDSADLIGLWLEQQGGKGVEKGAESTNPEPTDADKPKPRPIVQPQDSDFAGASKPASQKPVTLKPEASKPSVASPTNPSQPNKPSKPSQPNVAQSTDKTKPRKKILCIDAGHGGEDPGAIGPAGTMEKDVVLSMALQLAQRMRTQHGWRVVLTRDGDYFVPLAQRVKKARAARADVFVSLHADAFISPSARGASVFALSQKGASSAAAKWLANKENEADAIGGLNVSDTDKQLASVMLDLSTTAQIKSSLKLGAGLLKQLGGVAHLYKTQVEQAGFAVLKAPDIASVLIETAFISHPEEEKLLADAAHQARLVRAIAQALAGLA